MTKTPLLLIATTLAIPLLISSLHFALTVFVLSCIALVFVCVRSLTTFLPASFKYVETGCSIDFEAVKRAGLLHAKLSFICIAPACASGWWIIKHIGS